MTAPRIFFSGSAGEGELCELGEQTLRYIKSVLRMKKGEHLILFDGAGWEYEAEIKTFLADGISVEVLKKNRIPDETVKISLFQALPKAHKMDFIVQKATELGADRIVSFQSARSVPRLSPDKVRAKISRWRSIATEAARQCGRADIPGIVGIVSFEEMFAYSEREPLKIIFWEEESERGIKEVMRDKKYAGVNDISVVIGPEGGFSRKEIESAADKGFISVTLGKNILKVETAALTILSIIQYEKGIFGGLHCGRYAE